MASSIFPDVVTGGAVVIRDADGNPTNPPDVNNAYVPDPAFVSTCELTALPSTCDARIDPRQINAIVSELVALAECMDPDGPWDCNSLTNLCAAFTVFAATIAVEMDGISIVGAGTPADPFRVGLVDGDGLQTVLVRRSEIINVPPAALEPGELGIEMAGPVPRLWVGVPASIDLSGRRAVNNSCIISDAAPINPTHGLLWWESDSGILWTYYNDGNTTQWVQAAGVAGGGSELEAFVEKAGDTMTGPLTLAAAPAADLQAATKKYVDDLVAAALVAAGAPTTGDARLTYKQVATAGWVMANDGSIGNAASGGTTRANADTQNLYTVMWNLPFALTIQDSTGVTVARGASAAADYAANRRLLIPKTMGRALAISGAGSGLTARLLGDGTKGAETETQTLAKLLSHNHGIPGSSAASGGGSTNFVRTDAANNVPGNTGNSGGGAALDVLNPSTYINVMIKL